MQSLSHWTTREVPWARLSTISPSSMLPEPDLIEWEYAQPQGFPLPTKVHLVKAMVFPVVVYECESGTVKKAER